MGDQIIFYTHHCLNTSIRGLKPLSEGGGRHENANDGTRLVSGEVLGVREHRGKYSTNLSGKNHVPSLTVVVNGTLTVREVKVTP